MPTKEKLTESQVRALRDRVYGHATSEKNWDGCKEKWLTAESIEWLQSQKPA